MYDILTPWSETFIGNFKSTSTQNLELLLEKGGMTRQACITALL